MKKTFQYYAIIWSVLLALFNVIAFVSVGWIGQEKYTPSFWIGYAFITLSFIGQFLCSFFALREEDLKKTFYNFSLIATSYTGLILSFVFGGLCMLISPLPYWVGAVLCAIVLACNGISVVKASAAVQIVSNIDQKIKTKTFFIKSLAVDADTLMASARSETIKAECRKVYEAIRYSDPMSHDALSSAEAQITLKFAELSEAVKADDLAKTAEIANELILLIGDRNQKCKLLK